MNKINEFFGKVLCINLDRRPDRWEEVQKEFERHGRLAVERLAAVDGKLHPVLGRLTPGETGCRMSHVAALEIAAQSAKPTLILEDDVEFQDYFVNFFADHIDGLPEWDLLYLGGNHVLPLTNGKFPVGRVRRTFTTSSYAVNARSAKELLSAIKNIPGQIDIAYAQLQPRLRCYAFDPPLAWQRPGYSDIQEGEVNYKKAMKK